MIGGYDISALFREDCLERIRHLQAEVEADMKEMKRLKEEHTATEERHRKLKIFQKKPLKVFTRVKPPASERAKQI